MGGPGGSTLTINGTGGGGIVDDLLFSTFVSGNDFFEGVALIPGKSSVVGLLFIPGRPVGIIERGRGKGVSL